MSLTITQPGSLGTTADVDYRLRRTSLTIPGPITTPDGRPWWTITWTCGSDWHTFPMTATYSYCACGVTRRMPPMPPKSKWPPDAGN